MIPVRRVRTRSALTFRNPLWPKYKPAFLEVGVSIHDTRSAPSSTRMMLRSRASLLSSTTTPASPRREHAMNAASPIGADASRRFRTPSQLERYAYLHSSWTTDQRLSIAESGYVERRRRRIQSRAALARSSRERDVF